MSVDPSDDCTFWYTDEYEPATGNFNWQTRLASFQLPNCTVATPDFSIGEVPTSGSVLPGGSATTTVSTSAIGGFTGTITFSASGLPAGTTATFSPAAAAVGTNSTLTLATSASTPTGTYTIGITGTSGTLTHTTNYTLTVAAETVTVTNPGNQTTTVGTAVSLQINATDSASKPLTFSATGLPAGLSISSSGLITGTPITAGTNSVVVTASSGTASGTASFTWTINPVVTGGIVNGTFEAGNLSGWTTAGVTAVTTSGPHSGTYAALVGSTSPSNTSSIKQTFTAPTGSTTLGFW